MNLDELKKKLLAALPPALREKMGIHLDDEEDDDEIDSDEATANHDLSEMGEGDEDDEGDEEQEDDEEDDEEAEKKAKRSKIIRAVAILAVIFFAADEFLNTEEEVVVPDVPAVMSPAKKALLEARKKEAEEAKLAAERAALETPEPTAEPTSEPIAIEEPEVETEVEPEPVVEVPPETPPEILTIEDEPTVAPTPEAVVTPDFMENIGQTTPSDNVPTPQAEQDNSLDALMQAVDKSGKMAEDNMKTQLGRNDPSYIEPPNYLRTGRGLVYNCREGHWACVDKFSYFTCFENQKWNEENVQGAECVTRDVYASGADCAAIQKFYVNKPEPTDFCGKKAVEEVKVESQSQPEDLSNLLAP